MERKRGNVIIGACENGKRVIEWEEKRPITQLQCLGAPPVAMSHTHSAFTIFSSSSLSASKESLRPQTHVSSHLSSWLSLLVTLHVLCQISDHKMNKNSQSVTSISFFFFRTKEFYSFIHIHRMHKTDLSNCYPLGLLFKEPSVKTIRPVVLILKKEKRWVAEFM